MEIKLFGKKLFEFTKGGESYPVKMAFNGAIDTLEKQEHLIDFYRDTGGSFSSTDYSVLTEISSGIISDRPKGIKKKADVKVVEKKDEITPKGVFKLKMLNDESFKMKTDPTYLEEQMETFKQKLSMIKSTEWDMNRGVIEIASMIKRFENRKKYESVKTFYEEFPYTTTSRIDTLIKEQSHLKMGQVEQFLADMPKDAVDTMKKYTTETKKLCEKKPIFYIIAKKKDFEKTQKRRDPILLAQSPFGHFWQILGAWDSEMLFLEEL